MIIIKKIGKIIKSKRFKKKENQNPIIQKKKQMYNKSRKYIKKTLEKKKMKLLILRTSIFH